MWFSNISISMLFWVKCSKILGSSKAYPIITTLKRGDIGDLWSRHFITLSCVSISMISVICCIRIRGYSCSSLMFFGICFAIFICFLSASSRLNDPSKPLSLTIEELKVIFGICIYMSVVKMSSHRRYWGNNASISPVTEYMSWARWEKIKSCITSKESLILGDSKYGHLLIVMALYTVLKYVMDQLQRSMDFLTWSPVLILCAN